tara:strand:- start:28680 stop:29003 length:324 start_codon:yes stop_codon:yes gene_type:complete
MTEDTAIHGETYDLEIALLDELGDPLAIDNTWLVASRFSRSAIGEPSVIDPTFTIAAGVATASIETDAAFDAGSIYFYDVRLTDPSGFDYWTDPVKLTVNDRNTPTA